MEAEEVEDWKPAGAEKAYANDNMSLHDGLMKGVWLEGKN